jgi:hypothetical protein
MKRRPKPPGRLRRSVPELRRALVAVRAVQRPHVEYADRAILAVDAMFDDADDLRAALSRSPVRVPWSRVYVVARGNATLVNAND